MKWLVDADAGC